MTKPTTPTSRAARYRQKAKESRAVAETMSNPIARDTVLDVAATWDRMADEEDKNQKRNGSGTGNPRWSGAVE